jgi:hypothetical protein
VGSKRKGKIKRWRVVSRKIRKYLGDGPLVGAEVGVWKGEFVGHIMKNSPRVKTYYAIDPYKDYSQGVYLARQSKGWTQTEWNALHKKVEESLKQYGNRVFLLRMTSEQAAKTIPDASLDFVFIDGNHSYEHVKKDTALWAPKVRAGGLVSGHDYDSPFHTGVKKAVDEFAMEEGVSIKAHSNGKDRVWWYIKEIKWD